MKLRDTQQIFRAFADETRLRILNLLSEGELCVCDVVRVLREPQSKISRHLGYLRKAGLVEDRRHGLWMHYKLSARGARMFPALARGLGEGTGPLKELQNDLTTLRGKRDTLVACCR